jgi:adenylylsulfate kinase
MIFQFSGLSGSGKTTLAGKAKSLLAAKGIKIEVIDGDEYRKVICKDLGFSKEDRQENIRRLAFIANKFSEQGIVAIICAINPYEEIRKEIAATYKNVRSVYISCDLAELIRRDSKGLYQKALLPDGHPDKMYNLTGLGDVFESPVDAHLEIDTGNTDIESSAYQLAHFIETEITGVNIQRVDIVKVRYNTESNGKEKVWRLLVNGKELLVNEIDIRKPSSTSTDWMEEKQCLKHHITVKDCLLHIDEETNKAVLS